LKPVRKSFLQSSFENRQNAWVSIPRQLLYGKELKSVQGCLANAEISSRSSAPSPAYPNGFSNDAQSSEIQPYKRLYAERLKQDGVPAEYAQFDGTFHGFVSFASIADVAARAMDLICQRIQQAVG
jgi:acetyl esterase/lipase